MKSIAIAGAGIIGLATALELASRGFNVTVFERGKVMQEASWAAAGMLAADDPENPAALALLARFSLQQYPAFLTKLEVNAGGRVPFLTSRTLQICDRGHGKSAKFLTPAEAVRRVPGLRLGSNQQALWLEEQSIDPRMLCLALPFAARSAGVRIYEDAPVIASQDAGGSIVVSTPQGRFEADALVVATGAWTSQGGIRDALHQLSPASVHPRKGQMLRLQQPAGPTLTTVLRSPEIYVVPRGNGNLIVGATVEDAGFDRAITEEATRWILEQAACIWSPIAECKSTDIQEAWTGLRPATADQLPLLGPLHHPRVLFATGHYRNGILLAPATASLIASMLQERALEIDISAFHPSRLLHQNALHSTSVLQSI